MKDKEFRAIARQLCERFPQFKAVRRGLYLPTDNHLLRSIHFSGSSTKDASYVHYSVWPLSIPVDHIVLSFGSRLRDSKGSEMWDRQRPDFIAELLESILQQAIPFLDRTHSLSDAIDLFTRKFGLRTHQSLEAVAHMRVMARDFEGARKALDGVIRLMEERLSIADGVKPVWVIEDLARNKALRELLQVDPERAISKLKQNEAQTLMSLKLEILTSG